MLMQVPEPETGPVDEAGRHVGGQRRQTGVEAGADEGLGAGRQGGSGSLCCQRIFSASLMLWTLGGVSVPAGEAIRARFRGLDGHPQVVGSAWRGSADQRLIELAHHVVAVSRSSGP
jgi:hypothetical protein